MEFILFGTLTREGEKVKNDSKSVYGMEFRPTLHVGLLWTILNEMKDLAMELS